MMLESNSGIKSNMSAKSGEYQVPNWQISRCFKFENEKHGQPLEDVCIDSDFKSCLFTTNFGALESYRSILLLALCRMYL